MKHLNDKFYRNELAVSEPCSFSIFPERVDITAEWWMFFNIAEMLLLPYNT